MLSATTSSKAFCPKNSISRRGVRGGGEAETRKLRDSNISPLGKDVLHPTHSLFCLGNFVLEAQTLLLSLIRHSCPSDRHNHHSTGNVFLSLSCLIILSRLVLNSWTQASASAPGVDGTPGVYLFSQFWKQHLEPELLLTSSSCRSSWESTLYD